MTVAPTPFAKLTELADVPHPFPYQGSKRLLAHAIVPMIPRGTTRILEPFCGSAAVSIAARHSGRVTQSVIADINGPLIDLWQAILDDPSKLAADYERMWHDQQDDPREYFWRARDKFNAEPSPAVLLYLLNRIVKGAVRYQKDGRFNQSPDHRRLGAKPALVRQRVTSVSSTMKGTEAKAVDFAELIEMASVDDLIYMDPPYQGTTNVPDHRYMRGLPRAEFEPVLQRMVDRDLSFIISYDVVRDDGKYGDPLSSSLGLRHLHVAGGRSSQATLLGKDDMTVESLYLSPALVERLDCTVDLLLSSGRSALGVEQVSLLF